MGLKILGLHGRPGSSPGGATIQLGEKMKLVSIERKESTDKVVVNAAHICSISKNGLDVVINMSNGTHIATKFSDVDHAVDYINRSAYVANTHRYGEFTVNNA